MMRPCMTLLEPPRPDTKTAGARSTPQVTALPKTTAESPRRLHTPMAVAWRVDGEPRLLSPIRQSRSPALFRCPPTRSQNGTGASRPLSRSRFIGKSSRDQRVSRRSARPVMGWRGGITPHGPRLRSFLAARRANYGHLAKWSRPKTAPVCHPPHGSRGPTT
jgi:hypothetical protein